MRRIIYFLFVTLLMLLECRYTVVMAGNRKLRAVDPGKLITTEIALDYNSRPTILTSPASGGVVRQHIYMNGSSP